jgi:hypothetical protein
MQLRRQMRDEKKKIGSREENILSAHKLHDKEVTRACGQQDNLFK